MNISEDRTPTIRSLLLAGQREIAVARAVGVSRQRVNQVALKLRAKGVPLATTARRKRQREEIEARLDEADRRRERKRAMRAIILACWKNGWSLKRIEAELCIGWKAALGIIRRWK